MRGEGLCVDRLLRASSSEQGGGEDEGEGGGLCVERLCGRLQMSRGVCARLCARGVERKVR